ncbi:flagellar hook-associated protein FlgK [Mesobaculum littorinae]|uniref:Flagellar hook-associated protein 1 n=1 Tax=Mesobaculum littorinae TaxID=2486419 RepID=A0A438ADU1_9RHOB|nr:flagellar hook-associated protein FlgK [Mesobaculum littorinae]RVV96864.1 flagellar hook-associated protein FlgK [Mesobaculum littorinae]
MSLSSAFLSSRSGLQTSARWAELTSDNIANAGRAGYARRGLEMASSGTGAGVTITGIRREADAALSQMHRTETARLATQAARAETLQPYVAGLGKPGDATAIPGRLASLQTAFDTLSLSPSEPAAQQGVLSAAEGLVGSLRRASDGLDKMKQDLVQGIRRDVASVNDTLDTISRLNVALSHEPDQTAKRATLEDQMAEQIDTLSGYLGINVATTRTGDYTITTTGGTALVEGARTQPLAYRADTGLLMAGERDVTPGSATANAFDQGSLAGRMGILQDDLPQMRAQLDGLAAGLVQAFEAADTSRTGGAPGLFTDAGLPLGDPEGLAGRIAVNDAVRPGAGGALWRLRDGVGAAAPGPVGATDQIDAFARALGTPQRFDPAAGLGQDLTPGDFAAAVVSAHAGLRTAALDEADAISVGVQAVETSRAAAEGVNLDDELQQLMLIEQSYAANSKVMSAVANMLDTLIAAT